MKKLLFSLLFTALFTYTGFSQSFSVSGTWDKPSAAGEWLRLEIGCMGVDTDTYKHYDSIRVTDGKFSYKGTLKDGPVMARLMSDEKISPIKAQFVLEPGDILVKANPQKLSGNVSGTPINNDYDRMVASLYNSSRIRQNTLDKARQQGLDAATWTTDDEAAYREASTGLAQEKGKGEMEFIDKYIDRPQIVANLIGDRYSTSILVEKSMQARYGADYRSPLAEEIRALYARLPENYRLVIDSLTREEVAGMEQARAKQSTRNREVELKIKEVIPEAVEVGKPFTDFSGTTSEGKPFSLKEAVEGNKLVVIDFWASWCMPCMKEMPNVAALHKKYKDRGVAVIGVSSDQNEGQWRKAIERANMVWPQLRSTGEDRLSTTYGVKFIPYTVVIDHTGTIVARNLHGAELDAKIAELLK